MPGSISLACASGLHGSDANQFFKHRKKDGSGRLMYPFCEAGVKVFPGIGEEGLFRLKRLP